NPLAEQISFVEAAVNSHRHAQTTRSARQFILQASLSPATDDIESFDGFKRSHQHGVRNILDACHDIELVVHPIDKVNVGGAANSVHGFGAICSPPATSVRNSIFRTAISFGFHNDASHALAV